MVLALHSPKRRVALALAASTVLTPLPFAGAAFAQEALPVANEPVPPTPTQRAENAAMVAVAEPVAGVTPANAASEQIEGDIVVTATRSAQSIQRVPISIQALSPEILEQRQISSFADYANLLPSVSFSTLGPGRSSLFFRGITSNTGLSTAGTYLDEIPITTAGRLPDVHVYDIERVEALSGPQGTLFGANSLSGTLRIITKKPDTSKFEAGYNAELNKFGDGNFGTLDEGFVNVPVTDNIAVRLTGFYRRDGGYIDNTPAALTYQLGDANPATTYSINNNGLAKNDYNPVTEYGGRAAIGIDLSDDWTVLAGVTAQHLNAKGSFNYDPDLGNLKVHDFSPTFNKDKWYQAALTINGKIGDFDIVSATGYFDRKIKNANDYTYYTVTYDNFGPGYESYLQFHDNTTGALINPTQQYLGRIRQNKFTQELRVSTPSDWRFHVTAGGFYQRQKQKSDSDYYIPGLANAFTLSCPTAATVNPNALPVCANGAANVKTFRAVKRDAFYLVENDTTFKDYAVFAEGTFDLTDQLKITGGIRFFKADNLVYGFAGVRGSALSTTRARDLVNNVAGCARLLPFNPATRLTCVNTNIPYKQKGETHKVSVTYQIDPRRMVYATYSTGFRPGGGNRIAPNNPYKADTLDNYEVGFKTSWGSNFRFNGSFYYEEWKGVQYGVVPFGFQGAGITVNAGDARVYGVEMDADLRLGALSLSAKGAYNDAKLATNFCNLQADLSQLATCDLPGQAAADKGTRLPRQPKLKFQTSARYEVPVSDTWRGYGQAVLFYQSSSTSNLDEGNNALLGNTPKFASMDFTVGMKTDTLTIEAFIQNAFDRRGQLSKNTFCSIEYCASSSRTFPIKPQFFGVRVGQRF